jgi:predicted Holliday junction resolvase-like endonuclease
VVTAVDDTLLATLLFALAGWALAWFLLGRWRAERRARRAARSDAQSRSTRYGNITEQFAPWMERWPFEAREGFRFLGKPVDGVQFADDAVYFVEIKAAGSRLQPSQRAVRDAVLEGRVGWVEFRVDDEGSEPVILRPWRRESPPRAP